jgi:antitoxin ParD1/3/4
MSRCAVKILREPSRLRGRPKQSCMSVVVLIPAEVVIVPTVEKLSIALPAEMAAIVRLAVDAGEYSSNSEVIRDALRDWTHKRRLREQEVGRLRKLWLEAVEDDSPGLDADPVFEDLERRYDALAGAKGE